MKKSVENCVLGIDCESNDKEIFISDDLAPIKNKNIKELIVYGNRKVEKISFKKSICPKLEKISIKCTSIRSFEFLKYSNFENLKELNLTDNCIKTNKREILDIIKSLRKIEKLDISNKLPTFSEDCNYIEDFESDLKLPELVIVENCDLFTKKDCKSIIERINIFQDKYEKYESNLPIFKHSEYIDNKVEESYQKPSHRQEILMLHLLLIVNAGFFLFSGLKLIKNRSKKKNE